jgi:predicted amidohydrolase YtcJ
LEPPANRILFPQKNNRNPEVLAPLYRYAVEELAAMGMTGISSRFPEDTVAAFRLLESKGQLITRIAYGLENFAQIRDVSTEMKQWASKIGTGSDKVWISSMGGNAIDGAGARRCMSTQRAGAYDAVLDSYWPMGACNIDSEYHGAAGKSPRTSGNYFRDWMIASGRSGVRFANTHVAGERAVKLILDLAQMAVDESGPDAVKNWALDHCTYVNPDDLPRAARMGITFSCAPKYIMDATAATAQAYGDSAANNWVVPVKSMLDHGIRVAFESDRDMSVWYEIELLITRKDAKGKVWGPQERIDRTAALKTATIAAAEYILKGDQLGSIEPGKWADLVVLDRDYMTIPVEQIHEIQPQVTVFDGKIVFVHSQFAQEYNVRPAGAVISTYDELIARRPDTGGGGD